MEINLKNKTVIITGASSGIGKESARLFLESGSNVVLAARSIDKLKSMENQFSDLEGKAISVMTDVRTLKDCRNLVNKTIETFGSADVLVNNAGFTSQGNVTDVPLKDLEQTIDVNLKATVRLTKLFIPHILESSDGRIINVSSLLGIIPIPSEAVYSATKFGIRAFSYALAEELEATNVRVCIISPGPVDTPFIMDNLEKLHNLVLSPPLSTPEEIAKLILISARDGKMERIKPAHTGLLAKIGFLVPPLRRLIKPVMERQGRKKKERLLNTGKDSYNH